MLSAASRLDFRYDSKSSIAVAVAEIPLKGVWEIFGGKKNQNNNLDLIDNITSRNQVMQIFFGEKVSKTSMVKLNEKNKITTFRPTHF